MEDSVFFFLERFRQLRHIAELSMGAAGTLFGLFGLGQSSAYHKHNLQWAEIDYFLQVRQVHIETLNNMREDLRDMYEMDGRRLDTRMIVATLLLGIGFGFVVEGTFPAKDPGEGDPMHEAYKAQKQVRVLYAVVAALSLLCPFWSMLALIECRRRLDFFMNQFNDKFYRMLKHRFHLFLQETRSADVLHDSNLVRYTVGLPEEPHPFLERLYNVPFGCPSRRDRGRGRHSRGTSSRHRQPPPATPVPSDSSDSHTPGDFEVILALHNHYATWRYNWCRTCQRLSSAFTWLAMVFNLLCCAILLGMYFQYSYPDTPEMWRWYSFLVLAGLALALALNFMAHFTGPRVDKSKKHLLAPNFIPRWMTEGHNTLSEAELSLPGLPRHDWSRPLLEV